MNPASSATAAASARPSTASARRSGPAEVSFAEALTPAPDAGKAPMATAPIAELPGDSLVTPENGSPFANPFPPAVSPVTHPAGSSPMTPGGQDPAPDPFEPLPHRSREDPLDPAARHVAQLGPPFQPPPTSTPTMPPAPSETSTRASLESMLPDLVRKIAWAGDGKKGSMRLELGAGALAGGTLVVHADGGRVRVELNAPPGIDVDAWRRKLEARLEGRGLAVDEIAVR